MKNNLLTFILIFGCGLLCPAQSTQHFSEVPIFVNGINAYACYRIPAIIKAPNGELLAFAEGRVNGCNDFGNVDIVMRKSTDNGLTWNKLSLLVDNGKLQAGNPAPVVDFHDPNYPQGRIFLFYNTGTDHEGATRKGNGLREVWYITSLDNGITWSSPTNITTSVHRPNKSSINVQYNFQEDWRSYANTPGHAIQLNHPPYKGRIFIPANHSQGEPQEGFNDYNAHAFYSDDHGKSWHLSESIDVPSSNESHAVELSDGRIMQNIRHQNGSQKERLIALSSDGGKTWDSTYFDPQLPSPVCQASIIDYTTTEGFRVLLFSNPNSQKYRKNMTVRVSYDDGQTWLLSRIIREGESAYSDLVILKNHTIGLLYEHGNDGGIHFSNFNFEWLSNGKNHTDNPYVQKVTSGKDTYAQSFEFALAPPIINSETVFFEAENIIKLHLDLKDVRIHYTLDGSSPDELSSLYSDEILLKESAILKAKAYHHQCRPSAVVEAQFIKLGKHIPIKNISLNRAAHQNYPGKGAKGLVDRKKGSDNFRSEEWMGFSGKDLEVLIEFEQKTSIQKVSTSMLSDHASWIFLPQTIEVYSSENGHDYELVNLKTIDIPKASMAKAHHFLNVSFEKEHSKFLKVLIKNIPAIPEWHDGKGTAAWLFIDEILIE